MSYFLENSISKFCRIIEKNNFMNFYKWTKNDIFYTLISMEYLEPIKSQIVIPDIVLVPLLAFDIRRTDLDMERFYDKYLRNIKKYIQKYYQLVLRFLFKNIITYQLTIKTLSWIL